MVKSVYIIDDDEVSLYLTRIVIELYSPETTCTCFDNATEALHHLKEAIRKEEVPHLILLDLNMPVMNGFDFLEALKPLESKLEDKCHVCILTSSVSEQDKLHAEATGLVLGLIQKPFAREKLDELNLLLLKKE